jgi:hypothetical protein
MKKMQDEMSKMKEELSKKVEDAISGRMKQLKTMQVMLEQKMRMFEERELILF